jgi:drug/metabolite transporter (DMT)-like permease
VPVIAAVGGIVWLGEEPTARLAVAATLTLGGIFVVVAGRRTN